MYELVYSSRATSPMSSDDLSQMLSEARERNRASGVSGLLVFDGEGFVQLLEGPQDQVEAIYSLIDGDSRHDDLQVLWRGESEELEFADWDMAFLDTREGDWRQNAELSPFVLAGTRAISKATESSRSTGRKLLLSLRMAL